MTATKATHHLRTGCLAILAVCILSWCSLQWTAFLHITNLRTPTHPWWSQASKAHPPTSPQSRIQYHEWNVTRADINPDGVGRPMILVNDLFPGPPLEANVGDTLVIKVNNRLSIGNDSSSFAQWDSSARSRFSTRVDEYYPPGTDDRISIHWHGLSMRGNPEQDGAPGFTSCAIPPGLSEIYRFQVRQEDVGTHWWHSHSGMGRSDGLWGTFVVRDPNKSEEKLLAAAKSLRWEDEQVITLGDHYFAPGIEQISWFVSRHSLGFEPTPDNILINGRGTFDCRRLLHSKEFNCSSAQQQPTIDLAENKTHRLRLVNVGSVGHQTFSIDRHTLTVIEADGVIIEPYVTQRISIAPGQRYSVLVTANQTGSKSFWMRSEMHGECFNVPNPNLSKQARAVVRYTSDRQPSFDLELRTKSFRRNVLAAVLPQTQPWPRTEQPCHDEPPQLLRPLRFNSHGASFAPHLNLTAGDRREIITVTMPKMDRNGLVPVSWINRTQWRSPSVPLLHSFATTSNPLPFDSSRQTVLTPSASEPVTLELIINNPDEAPHPFHLHGHKFYTLAVSESNIGFGSYPNPDAFWLSEQDAVFRDTLSVPRRGFAVIRWTTDNPGVWAMHCHVLVHMVTGMALAVVEQPQALARMEFTKRLGGRCPSSI